MATTAASLGLPSARKPKPDTIAKMDGLNSKMSVDEIIQRYVASLAPSANAYAMARSAAEDAVLLLHRAFYPQRLNSAYPQNSLVTGSVGKRTALAPVRTVDVLYTLPDKLRISRTVEGLKAVAAGLSTAVPAEAITVDELGVNVPIDRFLVRVIPALSHAEGLKIPGRVTIHRASGWHVSNPLTEASTLRLSDSINAGRPRQLLALLKAWRNQSEAELPSFALEILIQDFFATGPKTKSLTEAFKTFMAWARSRTPGTVTAPGSRMPLEVADTWHGKAKAAYWRATMAEQCAKEDPMKALLEWRHLLGSDFSIPDEKPPSGLPLLSYAETVNNSHRSAA